MKSTGWLRPLFPCATWITLRYNAGQHDRLRPAARPLGDLHRALFREFFPAEVLSETRLWRGPVPSPPLYPVLRRIQPGALNLLDVAGITFVDVIVHPGRLTIPLLFHELVHVTQYRVLGLRRFVELYVAGFLATGDYHAIPLEAQAYELGDRFVADPGLAFPVAAEVERRANVGKSVGKIKRKDGRARPPFAEKKF